MKKNIITIDLDKLEGYAISKEQLYDAKVPTPCTLTDAVERYDEIIVDSDKERFVLTCRRDVDYFIENHLYKEDVLEDGIYEGTVTGVNSRRLFYIENGSAYSSRDFTKLGFHLEQLTDLKKIAEL